MDQELNERYIDKDRDGVPDWIDSSYSPPEDELRYASVTPAYCDYLQEQGFSFSRGKNDGDKVVIAYPATERTEFEKLQTTYQAALKKGGR